MRSEYVSSEVMELALKKMSPDNALAVRLSLATGLRIGDCLKCRVDELRDGKLFYVAQKTGKIGTAVIGSKLEKELRLNSGGGVWCFPGRDGTKPRTRQAVYIDLKKCAKELGIEENLTPHSARKVFAVEELKSKSFAEVQEELQHTDGNVTMLYACADKLNGAIFGNTAKNEKNGAKASKNELLTPKLCENCVFSIGLDSLIDLAVERVLLALRKQQECTPEREPLGAVGGKP
jgi:integrase